MAGNALIDSDVEELGLPVPVRVRVNRKARRLVLSLSPCAGEARLTVPAGIPGKRAMRFLDERRGWLEARLAEALPPVPFEPGALIPVEGRERRLSHDPTHRGAIAIEPEAIIVGGQQRHMRRRVRDGLIAHSRATLSARVSPYAARIDRPVRRVSVRDTRSRWGSCAADGSLSFSWRLILAPSDVLTYVAVHEVAHLIHRDHSRRFWGLVEELMPDYRDPQRWLAKNGRWLHRYGVERTTAG